MKVALLSLLLLSSIVWAAEPKPEEQAWEGASAKVSEPQKVSQHNPWDAVADLEVSQPWFYGRQDSDAIVNRVRDDRHFGY